MASRSWRSPRAVVVLFRPCSNALPSSTPRKTFMPSARKECPVARICSTPRLSLKRFVARLLLTVIMSSQSCATVRVCPPALYKSVSESSLGSSLSIEPSTTLRNPFFTPSASSSFSFPCRRWWKSSIKTGTFIVLAAWNALSARKSHSAPPSRVRNAPLTSAPLFRMDSWIAGMAAASLGSCAAGQRAKPHGANTNTHQDKSVGSRNRLMQWRSGYAEGVTKYQMNVRQMSPARSRLTETPEPAVERARSSAPYPAKILPHCSTEFGLFSANCTEGIAPSSTSPVIFLSSRTFSYGGGTHGQGKQHFSGGRPVVRPHSGEER